MQDQPAVRPRRRPSKQQLPTFQDPVYLDDSQIESFEKRAARRRRRLPQQQRRRIKKASKLQRYAIGRCLVPANWDEIRCASFFVSRKRPDGDLAIGGGLVDLGCLGLKDGYLNRKISPDRAERLSELAASNNANATEVSPDLAAKILVHGTAYATQLGFEIPREYYMLRAYLGDPDHTAVDTPVPLGHRGKPYFVPGPDDDVDAITSQLEETLGITGFYQFLAPQMNHLCLV